MTIERNDRFEMRLSTSELQMLRALADDAGLTAADLVRTLVRHEFSKRLKK